MVTSGLGNIFRVTLWGESPGHRWISSYKGPVTRSFDGFLDARLFKRLNKQLSCQWYQTPLRSCDVTVICSPVLHISYFNLISTEWYLFVCDNLQAKFQPCTRNSTQSSDFTSYVYMKTAYLCDIYRDWIKIILRVLIRWYHSCPWPGNAICQDFISHGVDMLRSEHDGGDFAGDIFKWQ